MASRFNVITLSLILALAIPLTCKANIIQVIGRITRGSPKWLPSLIVGAGAGIAYPKLKDLLSKDEGAYAIHLKLNVKSSRINWADYFSKPDVFILVSVEGMGSYLVPELHDNYSGQNLLFYLKMPAIPKGRKVVIHVLDDDSSSNMIWNNILKTKVSVRFDLGDLMEGMSMEIDNSNWIINDNITLDAPDYLCEFVFDAPGEGWFSGEWNVEGNIKDESGDLLGSIGFSQMEAK